MILDSMAYGSGFKLSPAPFRHVVGGRAICADGRVRTLAYVGEPDTVWTRPAAVRVRGRYVPGIVEIATGSGLSAPRPHDPAFLRFIAEAGPHLSAFPGFARGWSPPAWQAIHAAEVEAVAAWVSAGADSVQALTAGWRARDAAEARLLASLETSP